MYLVRMVRNWEGEIAAKLGRMGPEDGKLLRRYDEEMRAAELSQPTRAAQLQAIGNLVDPNLPDGMGGPLMELKREDLVSWLANSNLAPSTKANRLVVIHKFFKWATGEDDPAVVRGLKVRGQKAKAQGKNGLQPKDLLTEEEVQAMIQLTPEMRDRALLSLLWDSGARLGEILALRVGDVTQHPRYPQALRVNLRESKTDTRELALFDCRYWLTKWLAEHPLPDREDAPLFPARNTREPLGEMGVRRVVRLAARRAKEEGLLPESKRVYAHLFRHSRTTDLLDRNYSETKLKQRQGWGMNTRMIARYAHLSERAAQEEDARLHGAEQEERKESALAPRVCRRCAEESPPRSRWCAKCGQPLTEEAASQVEEGEAKLAELVERLVEQKLRESLPEEG